jgi:CRP-like cAMP-binding protein
VKHVALVTSETQVHGYFSENAHTRNLHPRIINLLAQLSRIEHYKEGDYLFKQGDVAEQVYILREGTICLQSHPAERLHIWTIQPGEIVGWSCLTPPYEYLLDARASSDASAIVLDARALRERIPEDHELGFEIYQVLMNAAARRLTPETTNRTGSRANR